MYQFIILSLSIDCLLMSDNGDVHVSRADSDCRAGRLRHVPGITHCSMELLQLVEKYKLCLSVSKQDGMKLCLPFRGST